MRPFRLGRLGESSVSHLLRQLMPLDVSERLVSRTLVTPKLTSLPSLKRRTPHRSYLELTSIATVIAIMTTTISHDVSVSGLSHALQSVLYCNPLNDSTPGCAEFIDTE